MRSARRQGQCGLGEGLQVVLRRGAAAAVAFMTGTLCAFDGADAALVGLKRVAANLASPIYATHAPGDPNRLYIALRGTAVGGNEGNSTAQIRILNLQTGVLEPTPFLSIPGLNISGEGGLLGLAFHPDYANNGKFYVNVTANDSVAGTPFSTYIREYTRSAGNPNVANSGFTPVLEFTQPQSNHNGGWIGFGPNDGYLYIMAGDGGNGNDQGTGHTEPGGNAQDLTANFLGKALRIDVNRDDFQADANRNYGIPFDSAGVPGNPFAPDQAGGADPPGDNEIWSYGLRNPFRASFDRDTGDLWIGDVGQGAREEVDFQPANSQGGENYGWRLREGLIQTPGSVGGAKPPGAVDPVYEYRRIGTAGVDPNFTGNTVIGGYVYRGPDPDLQGRYFFGDSISSRLWTLTPSQVAGQPPTVQYISPQLPPDIGNPNSPVAFGEDTVGNLYVVYITGSVYRIETTIIPEPASAALAASLLGIVLIRRPRPLGRSVAIRAATTR